MGLILDPCKLSERPSVLAGILPAPTTKYPIEKQSMLCIKLCSMALQCQT